MLRTSKSRTDAMARSALQRLTDVMIAERRSHEHECRSCVFRNMFSSASVENFEHCGVFLKTSLPRRNNVYADVQTHRIALAIVPNRCSAARLSPSDDDLLLGVVRASDSG
ncbi:hypothetical protein GLAREA_10872 [Glarea lozoyensis ATCC 20868]|uniref:Uncharacterized protein n=1 Tax=Glarea lozoyensis (strain ATCC 20868 / MF5171) TaxID=1116229 RepID=S3DT84_GLAL2|nr:uncharacterized protein GLAREA_10872 [Glarea lozoyensis ATCC 20868]EPE35176.1 hypothetical protein GLAREA_10872 [Glarea lozoyensis ATCC 20868]